MLRTGDEVVVGTDDAREVLGPDVGHGAFGHVYAVKGRADLCAKIYDRLGDGVHEELDDFAMGQIRRGIDRAGNAGLARYVAFPLAPCYDPATGHLVGHTQRLVVGQSLDEIMTSSATLTQRLDAAMSTSRMVGALHASGIIIGDVSPKNIIVDEGGQAVLVDVDSLIYLDDKDVAAMQSHVSFTPDWAHPRLIGAVSGGSEQGYSRTRATDNWALASLVYALLFYGYNPFSSVGVGVDDSGDQVLSTSQNDNKLGGYFPPADPSPNQTAPYGEVDFAYLPASLRALLLATFKLGARDERRCVPFAPLYLALWAARRRVRRCEACGNDYFAKLTAPGRCPLCEATRRGSQPAEAEALAAGLVGQRAGFRRVCVALGIVAALLACQLMGLDPALAASLGALGSRPAAVLLALLAAIPDPLRMVLRLLVGALCSRWAAGVVNNHGINSAYQVRHCAAAVAAGALGSFLAVPLAVLVLDLALRLVLWVVTRPIALLCLLVPTL